MANSVNQSTKQDLQQLEKMLDSYNQLAAKLKDSELSNSERQIINASLCMLKEFMTDKTRDIKRRLRETLKY